MELHRAQAAEIASLKARLVELRAKIETLRQRNEATLRAAVSLNDHIAALRAANTGPTRAQAAGSPGVNE